MGPCEVGADRQIVRGGRVYIIAVQEGLLFFVGWLSPLFKVLKKWLPRFAEIEATISVHVTWMHFYFYGFYDETVPVSGFCGKEFGIYPVHHVTDILHPPAYEDGTDKEFRNVGY